MSSNKPLSVTIPANTQYKQCTIYINGVGEPCPNPRLSQKYDGEIIFDPSYQEATFSRPTQAACYDLPRSVDCKLEFTLSQDTLLKLAKTDKELSAYLKGQGFEFPPGASEAKPPFNPSNRRQGTESTDQPKDGSSTTSGNFIDSFFSFGPPFWIFIVLFISSGFLIKFIWKCKRPSSRVNRAKDTRSSFSAEKQPTTSTTYNQTQVSSSMTDQLNRQIYPLLEKVGRLSSKVEQLETDLFSLTQQVQSSSIKSTIAQSIFPVVPSLPLDQLTQSSVQLSLTVDLIKKAVASNDYNLISVYPHFFLSETPESQQGLTDSKRFSIDGDQSQASSRTQSEFIAITCNVETYLIPNIVPNASDPARTLKRHADKNNIYRNGQGTSLLNLDQLAVVQRNGNRFELITPGQIV